MEALIQVHLHPHRVVLIVIQEEIEVKKPSLVLYKLINFTIKGTVYSLILIHLLLYGWYRYELQDVDLTPYQGKIEGYQYVSRV